MIANRYDTIIIGVDQSDLAASAGSARRPSPFLFGEGNAPVEWNLVRFR
jgi:hypothetical protein